MKATDLTVLSCALPSSTAADTLLELLDNDGFTPTTWEDIESHEVRLDVFLEDANCATSVEKKLLGIATLMGLSLHVTHEKLPVADWAETWKRFFHVEHISEHIVICPSWETYTPQSGECVITLDPGMSFGTGKHPTTQACLQLLDSLATDDLTRPVLDMGCGSGILSIAAKKLGFTHVRGFDYDPDAVQIAKENALLNHEVIPYEPRDLADNMDEGAIVLANILGPVIIQYALEIVSAVQHGGHLIASGILDTLYPEVRTALEAQGVREVRNIVIGEWRSGLFVRENQQ
ncbi:MAG: 50S ribosomal protein L11 methyltransferase [Kiritimatiellia bacterium]